MDPSFSDDCYMMTNPENDNPQVYQLNQLPVTKTQTEVNWNYLQAKLIEFKYCDLSQHITETWDTNFEAFDRKKYVETEKANLYSQR